jgi:hypothetical protein
LGRATASTCGPGAGESPFRRRLDSFNFLVIEVDEPDRILPGQVGIVIILKAIKSGPVGGGFGDDCVLESADGLEEFESA